MTCVRLRNRPRRSSRTPAPTPGRAQPRLTQYASNASNVAHGYLRKANGTFKVFDAPGAAQQPGRGTFVSDLNDFDTVTGTVFDAQFGAHGYTGNP